MNVGPLLLRSSRLEPYLRPRRVLDAVVSRHHARGRSGDSTGIGRANNDPTLAAPFISSAVVYRMQDITTIVFLHRGYIRIGSVRHNHSITYVARISRHERNLTAGANAHDDMSCGNGGSCPIPEEL